jgi:hypothetical protein
MSMFSRTRVFALAFIALSACSDSDEDDSSAAAGGSTTTASSAGGSTSTTVNAATGTPFTFFATSVGSGDAGGNLGGLTGADATCQRLATAVNAGSRTWHAYLSTSTESARDRIGSGPWYNQKGELIAETLTALHDPATVFNGNPNRIVDENGAAIPGPQHDILTGSNAQGQLQMSATTGLPLTCSDWTSNAADVAAQVGHSDIPGNPMFSPSWNGAHEAQDCTAAGLVARGGAGRLYCFAIN